MTTAILELYKDAIEKAGDCKEKSDVIVEVYNILVEFEAISRKEGFLGLTDALCKVAKVKFGIELDPFGDFIYKDLSGVYRIIAVLVDLIASGTEPEQIEELIVPRYYASRFQGADALAACMAIYAGIAIRKNTSGWDMKQQLLSMLPENVENIIIGL